MPSKKNYYRFPNATPYRSAYHGRDSMFSWTIFIFFLVGFALFCWVGSFYVFGHPEKPTNYRLLKYLHKIETPQCFEVSTVPRGEFLKPAQLLERFGHLEPLPLEQLNEKLLRHFIRNYHQTRDLIPYAVGTYKIVAILPLDAQKLFSPGVAILLQAVDQPNVFLEQVMTTDEKDLTALQHALTVGEEIKLEKPADFSAIIFISPLPQGGIKATTVPLLYGTYGATEASLPFTLHPPKQINITAGLPFFPIAEAAKFIGMPNDSLSIKKELHRVGKTETSLPDKAPTSPHDKESNFIIPNTPPQIAPAVPINQPSVLPAIPVSTPKKEPPIPPTAPAPLAAPSALPETQNISSAPLTSPVSFSNSFTASAALPSESTIATTPPPSAPLTNGWSLYEPGQMPRGRLIDAAEIPALAEQGLAGERLYLQGNFIVTASGLDRAVLRYQSAKSELPLSRVGKIRVIAIFPPGVPPPSEGLSLTRDTSHPLMITDVKKENDGTVNLYVKEITK